MGRPTKVPWHGYRFGERMTYSADKHHRHSTRLPSYDYRQAGAYFLTVCSHQRQCLFGHVSSGQMVLNLLGEILRAEWLASALVRPHIELDAFVVMPNHVHGIIILGAKTATARATHRVAPTTDGTVAPSTKPHGPARDSIGAIIGQFKSITTKRINALRDTPGIPVWQRNYYEHIVRDDAELDRVRQYIRDNPMKWPEDTENPQRLQP